MILVPVALAFFAFVIASNLLKKFWQWLVAAVITFAVSFLALDAGNEVLITIMFISVIIIAFILRYRRK